jgi:hypothetical protein
MQSKLTEVLIEELVYVPTCSQERAMNLLRQCPASLPTECVHDRAAMHGPIKLPLVGIRTVEFHTQAQFERVARFTNQILDSFKFSLSLAR